MTSFLVQVEDQLGTRLDTIHMSTTVTPGDLKRLLIPRDQLPMFDELPPGHQYTLITKMVDALLTTKIDWR